MKYNVGLFSLKEKGYKKLRLDSLPSMFCLFFFKISLPNNNKKK